jgi:hypothetical protein
MTVIDLRMVASLATAAYAHGDRMCGAIADHYDITRPDDGPRAFQDGGNGKLCGHIALRNCHRRLTGGRVGNSGEPSGRFFCLTLELLERGFGGGFDFQNIDDKEE